MPIYTFTCSSCAHSFDALAGRDTPFRPCPQCAEPAERATVYRISHSGFTKTPVNEREIKMGHYLEASAELEYRYERTKDNLQEPDLPAPPLWRMAKAKAEKLMKAGAKDSSDVKLAT